MKKIVLTLVSLIVCLLANLTVAYEVSSVAKVSRIVTSTNVGDGDVYFSLTTNGAICTYGYFITKSQKGFDASFSLLLSAYHAQTTLKVNAIETSRWANSGSPVCEAYSLEIVR